MNGLSPDLLLPPIREVMKAQIFDLTESFVMYLKHSILIIKHFWIPIIHLMCSGVNFFKFENCQL